MSRTLSITEEMSFCQWLGSIFSMSDDDIYDRCGNDALQYLRFVWDFKLLFLRFATCLLDLVFVGFQVAVTSLTYEWLKLYKASLT